MLLNIQIKSTKVQLPKLGKGATAVQKHNSQNKKALRLAVRADKSGFQPKAYAVK